MDQAQALLHAQSIWGAGNYNAKVQRVGRKFRVGRHNSKRSWILGEGASWEEAFMNYWESTLNYRLRVYALSPATARGLLSDSDFHAQNSKIRDALDKGEVPII